MFFFILSTVYGWSINSSSREIPQLEQHAKKAARKFLQHPELYTDTVRQLLTIPNSMDLAILSANTVDITRLSKNGQKCVAEIMNYVVTLGPSKFLHDSMKSSVERLLPKFVSLDASGDKESKIQGEEVALKEKIQLINCMIENSRDSVMEDIKKHVWYEAQWSWRSQSILFQICIIFCFIWMLFITKRFIPLKFLSPVVLLIPILIFF